jgi:hypothetical protein
MAVPYPGNIPSNVGKDAKYSVSRNDGDFVVKLLYRTSTRDRELLTNDQHPDLVDMVNAVKTAHNGVPGGAFYINEYHDVLVPTVDGQCIFAGTYQLRLEFKFEDGLVSAHAPEDLRPGDPWPGPRVGIRHKLKAGGRDIAYVQKHGNRETEFRLSDEHGANDAARLARRIASVIGDAGGRIYINEAAEFFAPSREQDAPAIYLGSLGDDVWFPPPSVPR